jgi:hypothetical protein
MEVESDGIPREDTDLETSESTDPASEMEETPKPKRMRANALRRTG